MVQAVQSAGYYPAYYSAAPGTVATMSAGAPASQVYATDSFQNTGQSTGLDINKQAGFLKRMGNGVGNAFGRMADWVGLGTISHYAKQNFQAYDADRSNHLDSNEFTAVSQMIQRSFQQVDSNADQKISLGEFKHIVGDLVNASFKTADTSADGFLNYAEASAMGYVVTQGSQDSFVSHDLNQDQLLSRNEFAGLVNDMKLKRR
ncbi:MAG: hypothetical protein CVV27_06825 [Candidatus Melainabacteria bacterium HGW-Melainabacteria-1]|nr:MAG: hypothetical protein CVV27_06825 [Candidatus Melainabacteria bacterium HGW-Melainabacteria-1]